MREENAAHMNGRSESAQNATAGPATRPRFRHGGLPVFFGLAFALAWLLWWGSGVLRGPAPRTMLDGRWFVAQVGVFIPSLVALLLSAFEGSTQRRNSALILAAVFVPVTALGLSIARRSVEQRLNLDTTHAILVILAAIGIVLFFSPMHRRVKNPGGEVHTPGARNVWILASALFPLALFAVALSLTGSGWSSTTLGGGWPRALWNFTFLWCFNLMFAGALGEEIGWRGFAMPRLLRRFSPVTAGTILAVFWALWHAPIDLRYGFGLPGVGGLVLRLIWTWGLTMIFTWFFLRAGGNILAPLFLHTSFNVITDLGFPATEQAVRIMFVLIMILGLAAALGLPSRTKNRGSQFDVRGLSGNRKS